jgi:S1-C subfamily serine protease
MSGHGHVDLGSAMADKMPPPYCEGPWRQWTIGLGAAALITLAITIEEHFRMGNALAATQVMPAAPAGPVDGALMPVAATRAGPGAWTEGSDPGFRLVMGTSRTAFNEAAQKMRPSVVGVRAVIASTEPRLPSVERVGSGVVIDASGYAVSCNHVVTGATNVVVSRFHLPHVHLPASVLAVEEDLVLLKIQSDAPLPAASLADSDQVQVGDWVLAVGHPFGLGLTVTSGIVGRRHGVLSIPGGPEYTELLQTDAPINEGSSGGPLVNLTGEVIGLNTAIYAPTGVFSGAGFAVPSNRIRQFLARHLPSALGASPAPGAFWGIRVGDLSPAQKAQFPQGGVVVLDVEAGSPATSARIVPGDVVLRVAERTIGNAAALRTLQGQLDPRAPLRVQVWRQGRAYDLTLNPV